MQKGVSGSTFLFGLAASAPKVCKSAALVSLSLEARFHLHALLAIWGEVDPLALLGGQ